MKLVVRNCAIMLILCTANLALTCPKSCKCGGIATECGECTYETELSASVINICCSVNATTKNIVYDGIGSNQNITVTNKGRCKVHQLAFVATNFTATQVNFENNNIDFLSFSVNASTLKDLNLSRNNISKFDNNAFQNFTQLLRLNINSNKLEYLEENCFFGLLSLQDLDISNNKLVSLTKVFYPLKNLQHLNLSRNRLEHLMEESFSNALLQHLDLSHNRLSRLSPGALQYLPNLARLLLTDNSALGANQLDGQLLLGTGRRLQQVDVSRTGLLQIPEAFTHSVRFLSLAGNKISAIRGGDLDSYPLLQSLDFTENSVKSIEDDSFGRLEMLLFLNLNNNLLTIVPKMLPDELKYLSINNNLIANLTMSDFYNLPNLRILLLQNNKIEYIQENVFVPLSSLEILDLSNNPIQILTPSTFKGPQTLKDLRLCYLNISLPEMDTSFPVPSPEGLQMLHLQSSPGLARQLLADSAVLAALSHLQYLDLRMNHLTDVRTDLVFYLSQLRTLRLHGNNLNCTSAGWLNDWVSWDRTALKNESCYFSVINDDNENENQYNCTFSESFTINDSLPPVSLYSTEMINKLLRYYGYLNNKTELSLQRKSIKKLISKISKNNDIENNSNMNKTVSGKTKLTQNITLEKKIISNEIELNKNFKHEYKKLDDNVIINKYDNARSRLDGNEDHERLLDSKIAITNVLNEKQNRQDRTKHQDATVIKTGKTVNKAIRKPENRNTSTQISKSNLTSKDVESMLAAKISAITLNSSRQTDEYVNSTLNEMSESSPFQANSRSYATYVVGAFAATTVLVVGVVLWARLRLRYRQQRRTSLEQQEDHIEVASISGGVLW